MAETSSVTWKPIKVDPAVKALVNEVSRKLNQPEYIIFDIMLKSGGYQDTMTAVDLEALAQKAITRALMLTRGGDHA